MRSSFDFRIRQVPGQALPAHHRDHCYSSLFACDQLLLPMIRFAITPEDCQVINIEMGHVTDCKVRKTESEERPLFAWKKLKIPMCSYMYNCISTEILFKIFVNSHILVWRDNTWFVKNPATCPSQRAPAQPRLSCTQTTAFRIVHR